MKSTFLSAEWRKLILVNYGVNPALLIPYLPFKTELDLWNNTCYVSLVGFMFQDTRVKGWHIPGHTSFEEVNLRFYVRFKDVDGWKRGVVFIQEIVPKPAITWVANTLYNEKYVTRPMAHSWDKLPAAQKVKYSWKLNKVWNSMQVTAEQQAVDMPDGSEEEFITEHYWGYVKAGNNSTTEYGVEHPRWQTYPVLDYALDVDFSSNYGKQFGFLKAETPRSVFLAAGSAIKVKNGRVI